MAIRIEPLNGAAPAAPGGSQRLHIQPLDAFLFDFAKFSEGLGPLPALPPRDQGPSEPGASGGGSGGSPIGASLGFGLQGSPTAAEVTAQFGHLAGRSPLSAALTIPTLGVPTTPAGLLSAILSFAPPGIPLSLLLSPVLRAMQQSQINKAVQLTARGADPDASDPGGLDGPAPAAPSDPGLAAEAAGLVASITAEAAFGPNPSGLGLGLGLSGPADAGGSPGGAGEGGSGAGGIGGGPGDAGGGSADFHQGGLVTKGPPKGPSLKATLLEGEFVIKKGPAQKHRPLLEAINRGESPQKLKKLIDYLMTDAPKAP